VRPQHSFLLENIRLANGNKLEMRFIFVKLRAVGIKKYHQKVKEL